MSKNKYMSLFETLSEEEQRYITLGRLPGKLLIVLVVSTDRNGITRIISARYASKKEEQLYYG